MVTRALDPVALERARMRQVCSGSVPVFDDVTDALIYTTLQELATRISGQSCADIIAMARDLDRLDPTRLCGLLTEV